MRGDGIARISGVAIYVPFTAPGDRLRVRLAERRGDGFAAEAVAWLARSADRREPPCPAFGACGGCAWQHLGGEIYARVKRDLLIEALGRQRLRPEADFPVEPARISPPGDRRRVRFAGRRDGQGVVIGLRERAGHAIVDLSQCPVAAPTIQALLAPCRAVAATLDVLRPARRPAAFQVAATLTDGGLDVTWTLPVVPGLPDRERLARFADDRDLARVGWRLAADESRAGPAEPIAARRAAQVTFGATPVDLPPDAFLQAGRAGEAAIRDAVLDAVKQAPKGPVADLFAGCGTLSLPLAASRAVHAVDGDSAAIAVLGAAARRAALGRVSTELRDLMRRPLLASELARFAAVVFDPPSAGAQAQAQEIARSKLRTAVAVSCEPATLARDLRLLVDGGYAIERVVPIDQFLWSPRVEAVAVLRR
ncbi:MAG: class I SAM-dependent RNA methyltransferase [Alphaproteobacteria bacterium]|nr:class I SAM-dependent RNA methyltransferase [Alphaproteobacteria bacterium]